MDNGQKKSKSLEAPLLPSSPQKVSARKESAKKTSDLRKVADLPVVLRHSNTVSFATVGTHPRSPSLTLA